jgi:four helix bundle protein
MLMLPGMERDIQRRAFTLARRVARLGRDQDYARLVRTTIARQLVRSAFSVGANVEEAAAAHTKPDFVAKMAVARKESREVCFWLHLAQELDIVTDTDWEDLRREALEVHKVVAAITRNAQRSPNRSPPAP